MSWQLASLVVVALALGAGFAWYERTRPSSRVIALVATLVAMAVLGRLAFAPLPNVKPATTDVILFAGFVLGAAPGFVTGAITALVSNFFISQGSWTPWQMVGWGAVGLLGAVLGRAAPRRELGRWPLAFACAAAGLMFGAVMNTYQLTFAAAQNLPTWIAISGQSLPFDLAHAIGNFVFCLAVGPAFIRAIARYRRRFEVRWSPAAATASGAVVAAACLTLGLAAPQRAEGSGAGSAVQYLVGAQNSDGGFGGGPGASSNALYTGWAGLGLAAGGRNPTGVRHGSRSVVDYARSAVSGTNDTGELERTILLLRASGAAARDSRGRDLVTALLGHRRGDGSFDESINWTAFGVLALRAAGGGSVQGSADWLAGHQNGDGGWGFTPHATSDVDDTAAVLEALGVAGQRSNAAVDRAVGFLSRAQNGDGGTGQYPGYQSNTQSTSWVVQGLIAVGRNPDSFNRGGHTLLGYIGSLEQGDGSVKYSSTSSQTPVWVTGEAIMAMERKPLPLSPPASGSTGGGAGGRGGQSSASKHRAPGASHAGGHGARTRGRVGVDAAHARGAGAARPALRRASEAVDGGSSLPSASVVLLITGAALLVTGLAGVWRAQRRAARGGVAI